MGLKQAIIQKIALTLMISVKEIPIAANNRYYNEEIRFH